MSRQSSASASAKMPAPGDAKTIGDDGSSVASVTSSVANSFPPLSGKHSSTPTSSRQNTVSNNLASHVPAANQWKFWSPARLAYRVQVKLKKCAQSDTGCYIFVFGVPANLVERIEDTFEHYEIRKQLRLTYEHALESLLIKCTVGIPHESISWTFIFKIAQKICQLPEHNEYCYRLTGTATFSVVGERSKQADGGLSPVATRNGLTDWPSVLIEVGDSQHLKDLRRDASWWLDHSGGRTRMVFIIKLNKDPMSLRLECWQMIDDESQPSTESRKPKVPGFNEYWEIDAAGEVTHLKDHPDIVILYLTVFDVDHEHGMPLIISKNDLKLWALHIFQDITAAEHVCPQSSTSDIIIDMFTLLTKL